MGYSSYLCKHCSHAIVSADSTDEGINEWMAEAVMMADDGSQRIEPKFSGYPEDRFFDAVWAHKACWELAGKPEFSAYDGPSEYDPNQGCGGKHVLVIDPRITEETERARLLEEGLKLRAEKIYARNAREVHEWLDDCPHNWHREEVNGELWRLRYHYHRAYLRDEKGELVLSDPAKHWSYVEDPTGWVYYDRLDEDGPEHRFTGTEEECKAHLAALWAQFIESDECKDMLVFRESEIAQYKAERLEEAKVEGRFTTTYGPEYNEDGTERWPVHRVHDELDFRTDKEGFYGDGSRDQAQAKADMLNKAWAKAGYPQEFEHEAFEDRFAEEDAA